MYVVPKQYLPGHVIMHLLVVIYCKLPEFTNYLNIYGCAVKLLQTFRNGTFSTKNYRQK